MKIPINSNTAATHPLWEEKLHSMQARLQSHPQGHSFLTLNNYGFSDKEENIKPGNWFMNTLLEYAALTKDPMLEVGGGYGSLTKVLLHKGATVILNDRDERHLLLARACIDPAFYSSLFLYTGTFPQEIIFPERCLSAVILSRVLLFLDPEEIMQGIARMAAWLIPGGRIFILTLPPSRGEFKDKILPLYEQRWAEGNPWPGYGVLTKDILPEEATYFPPTVHLLDERPLMPLLQQHGLKVIKHGLIQTNRSDGQVRGKEMFALIAIKS